MWDLSACVHTYTIKHKKNTFATRRSVGPFDVEIDNKEQLARVVRMECSWKSCIAARCPVVSYKHLQRGPVEPDKQFTRIIRSWSDHNSLTNYQIMGRQLEGHVWVEERNDVKKSEKWICGFLLDSWALFPVLKLRCRIECQSKRFPKAYQSHCLVFHLHRKKDVLQ